MKKEREKEVSQMFRANNKNIEIVGNKKEKKKQDRKITKNMKCSRTKREKENIMDIAEKMIILVNFVYHRNIILKSIYVYLKERNFC